MKIYIFILWLLTATLHVLSMNESDIIYKNGKPGCYITTVIINCNGPDEIKMVWYPIDHLPQKEKLLLSIQKKTGNSSNNTALKGDK
jgi:hypothetical protein